MQAGNELLTLIHSHRMAAVDLELNRRDPSRFWAEIFQMYFVAQQEDKRVQEQDDMLYFVRAEGMLPADALEDAGGQAFFAVRKESPQVPMLHDITVDWEQTVYLNAIMHQFEYRLAVAVCERKEDGGLRVLRKVARRVYASPCSRRMDVKEAEMVYTYPQMYFIIDDFEDCFGEMTIGEGQQIAVQLSATDPQSKRKCTIFQGGVLYEALLELFAWRKSSWAALLKADTTEFLPLRGPRGKGKAQMAVGVHDPGASLLQRLTPFQPSTKPVFKAFLTFIDLHWECIINDLLWK